MNKIELVLVGNRENRWRLEIKDLAVLRAHVGEDVVKAFVRCFVHSDRLVSLAHFGPLCHEAGIKQVALDRNHLTAVWFAIGTLRELGVSLRALRSALAKRGLLGIDIGPIDKLKAVEDRWENNAFLRGLRNTHAFHVNEDIITTGLKRLYNRTRPVTIVEGDSKADYETSTRIGSDAMFLGLGIDESAIKQVFQIVYDDFKIYLEIERVFLGVMKKVGVEVRHKDWKPERPPRMGK
jgi:hypothetical protein